MKKVLANVWNYVAFFLFFPFILLFVLFILLKAPVDYVRYRRSIYRKETGEKAGWWAYNDFIRLYDTVRANDLPLEYLRNTAADINGYGFWITGNAAITPAWGLAYDAEKAEWKSEEEDDEGDPVNREIAECHLEDCQALPGGEHCNFIYLLVEKGEIPEGAELSFETFRVIPYDPKKPLPALQEILKAENITLS